MPKKKKVAEDMSEAEEQENKTVDEQKAAEQAAKVSAVEQQIEADRKLREESGVVETPEQTEARELDERFKLEDAKGQVTDLERRHYEARATRVAGVKTRIEQARVEREAQEKNGVMETPGAKLDREMQEAKDLKEASRLNVIEPFKLATTNNLDLTAVEEKVNAIVEYLNTGLRLNVDEDDAHWSDEDQEKYEEETKKIK